MSRYQREHPDEPVRHDWIMPGRADLPPGCTLSEINAAFGSVEEIPCCDCGEWFFPEDDSRRCRACLQAETLPDAATPGRAGPTTAPHAQ